MRRLRRPTGPQRPAKEKENTLGAANNYASSLKALGRFEEAKSVLRKMMPVTQRVLGESHKLTLTIRKLGAMALYSDPDATLDDLREAKTTLEEIERMARRVMGGAHPITEGIEDELQNARAALARKTRSQLLSPPPGGA